MQDKSRVMEILKSGEEFKPAAWCRGANAQTIAGALFRPKPQLVLVRERIETPDGDFLDLDFLEGNDPTVVILHGLEGSSQAPYVLSLLGEIKRRAWSACAVNMRMCSGEPNRQRATYHSGKTEDLDCVLHYLKEKKDCARLLLMGFSIGGNIVLKWLGEEGEGGAEIIEKAVAVSVPYDLTKAAQRMDQGFNREVYTRALLSSLKAKLVLKKRIYPDLISFERIKNCNTFQIFDREITAPLNGFSDERDYWTQASSEPHLQKIRTPTLLIHAEDDPFYPGSLLPLGAFQKSDYLYPLIVPAGGHLGFVMGKWYRWEPWFEKRTLEFFSNNK